MDKIYNETVVEKIRREFEAMEEDFGIFQCFIDNPRCVRLVKRFMRNIKDSLARRTMVNALSFERSLDSRMTDDDYRWLKEEMK